MEEKRRNQDRLLTSLKTNATKLTFYINAQMKEQIPLQVIKTTRQQRTRSQRVSQRKRILARFETQWGRGGRRVVL